MSSEHQAVAPTWACNDEIAHNVNNSYRSYIIICSHNARVLWVFCSPSREYSGLSGRRTSGVSRADIQIYVKLYINIYAETYAYTYAYTYAWRWQADGAIIRWGLSSRRLTMFLNLDNSYNTSWSHLGPSRAPLGPS